MVKPLAGKDLKELNMEQLRQKLDELRKEYLDLRIGKVVQGQVPANMSRLHNVKKDIARVCTFIRKIQMSEITKKYENAKVKPKQIRERTTHRFRVSLTEKQLNLKSKRAIGHKKAFPKLVFAVKK